MASTIGWIGLGRMGEAMVKRLLKAGHPVSVWNRTAAKAEPLVEYGATIAASKQALSSCDVVFTMVSTTDDLKEVLFGTGGLVPCGTTATARTVIVTNNSAQSLALSLTLADAANSAYTVSGPSTVAAGAMATITVTPKPVPATSSTAPDAFADTLSITGTGGPINESHTVALHETAQGAVITLNPAALTFTNGQSKNFTVNNSGNLSAAYTLAVAGSNPGSFTVTPTSGTAAGGGSVTEGASYAKPLLSGPQSATVTLSTTAGRCAPLPAALTLSGN